MSRNGLFIRMLGVWALWSAATAASAGDTTRAEADMAHNGGLTYLTSGRADLAIEQFKKAISLDAKYYHAYKGLGIAYVQMKNFKEAEKAQRKCLEINPDFADARNDLGGTLISMGRRDEARKEWIVAYASPFNPSPDQTAWNLANSYVDDNNVAEATRWYQAALQHNPKYAPAHVGLASMLVAQNRLDEAIADLESAQQAAKEDGLIAYSLGTAYYKAGRFAEARTQLETVVKKDPKGTEGRDAAEMLKHFPK
jgi:type IV pilus assembly protein PilF